MHARKLTIYIFVKYTLKRIGIVFIVGELFLYKIMGFRIQNVEDYRYRTLNFMLALDVLIYEVVFRINFIKIMSRA
jgi:hypothetical protein